MRPFAVGVLALVTCWGFSAPGRGAPPDPDPRGAAFATRMQQRVLPENFTLSRHTVTVNDRAQFQRITRAPDKLRQLVADQLTQLPDTANVPAQKLNQLTQQVRAAYVDRYDSGFLGAYALALWFMRFDEDNWYSFAKVHAEAEPYLAPPPGQPVQLFMLKGVRTGGVLASGISAIDLPVVADASQQTLTFWWGSLLD